MTTHGQTIAWTGGGGLDGAITQSVSVEGCATREEAFSKAIQFAKDAGWTPPKWWQWWRWSEPIRSEQI